MILCIFTNFVIGELKPVSENDSPLLIPFFSPDMLVVETIKQNVCSNIGSPLLCPAYILLY